MTDSGTSGADPADSLPDLKGNVSDPGGCDIYEPSGDAIPGAASVFYGAYHSDGGSYTGEERWFLFANTTWAAQGGADCQVVWTASGMPIDPTGCGGCDLGLGVVLTVDQSRTTCSEDLVSTDDGVEDYSIARHSDGTSAWYFAENGEQFGSGYHIEGALNFVTESSCRWW